VIGVVVSTCLHDSRRVSKGEHRGADAALIDLSAAPDWMRVSLRCVDLRIAKALREIKALAERGFHQRLQLTFLRLRTVR
jgi:hypothetical protein